MKTKEEIETAIREVNIIKDMTRDIPDSIFHSSAAMTVSVLNWVLGTGGESFDKFIKASSYLTKLEKEKNNNNN